MSQLPSGLADTADDEELVARFLTSSSWFAKTTGRIKLQSFLPAPDNDTSVFGTNPSALGALWALGAAMLPRFHGAAQVRVRVVRSNNLDVIPQEPPQFHANIHGWPTDVDPELQKSKRMVIAQAIAAEAILVLKEGTAS